MSLMQLAMGPAGWASLAMKTIGATIAQQVIKQVGTQLGLPMPLINAAMSMAGQASGIGGAAGLSVGQAIAQAFGGMRLPPMQMGQLERQVQDIISDMAGSLSQSQEAKDAKAGGGKSWIMAIAKNMGEVADRLAKEMEVLSQEIVKGDADAKASTNVKFGAKSQEFSMFFNSANTVIKTLGEALSSGARKQ
jgi:hypothetical protein